MYWLVSTLALNFVLYGAIVAAAHGVEYYRRSREREHLEARLAETRLQLLSMQLQPHFLFNTLNTIAEMVHEDPDKADTMIAGLSDLLRRTLDLGAVQEIPLAEEIDLVSRYLDIQKARFGDRLRVRPRRSTTRRATRACRRCCSSRSSRTRSATASRRASTRAGSTSTRGSTGGMLVHRRHRRRSARRGDDRRDPSGSASATRGRGSRRCTARRCRLELTRAEGRGARVTIEIPDARADRRRRRAIHGSEGG